MNKNSFLIFLSAIPLILHAQESSQNYIQTTLTLDNGKQLVTIQYYDGLGRPFEKVEKKVTPSNNNMVYFTEYDALGRNYRQWLPAVVSADYLAPSSVPSSASGSHDGDTRPFTENIYDGSPLNRVISVKTTGSTWESTPVKTEYLTNTATFPLNCKDYMVQGSSLLEKGLYANSRLYVTKTTDMANHVSYTFTDVNGRKILDRQMNGNSSSDTYYVYDMIGDLRFVLQPMYQEEQDLDKYAFQYYYDHRHNVVEKKLPGAETVKYGYDNANRLVFSQDGRQHAADKASFMLYDKLGRMVVKGTCNLTYVNFFPTACTDATLNAGSGNIGQTGYNCSVTLESPVIESASYYDNYSFLGHDAFASMDFTAGTVSARGQMTAEVSFLNSSEAPNLCTAYHYDIKGRNVKTMKNNTLHGKETVVTTYSLTDQPLTVEHKIKGSNLPGGKQEMTERMTYTYDNADRLKTKSHQLDNNTPMVLASNGYNQLCRLTSKTVMGEQISYTYNIKDWVTKISSNNFTQQLAYLNNGNISVSSWKYGNASTFTNYSYSYDALNRITSATHIVPGQTVKSFYSTTYSYDRNGNITKLYRNAPTTSGTTGVMDRLDMAYDGNHLISAINSSNADDFMDCVRYEGKNDMEYDENGCLTKDLDKKISSIRYNSLNLPTTIDFRRDYYNTYMYNSKGQKVKEVKHMPLFELAEMNHLVEDVPKGVQGVTGHLYHENEFSGEPSLSQAPPLLFSDITYTIDYSDNLVFEDGKLKRILLDEGFIYFENNNTPTYHYYLKDHQGNNRAVVSAATKQKEESYDYYPFGKQFGDYHTGNIHPYRYNGKELDKINGLDWYYYGARMMEPAWGRFTTPDPLAEKYYNITPYAYCANNPVNAIDPDGKVVAQIVGGIIGAGMEYTNQVISNCIQNGEISVSAFTNVDLLDIGVAATEGAITCGGSALRKAAVKSVATIVTNAIDIDTKGTVTCNDLKSVAMGSMIDMITDQIKVPVNDKKYFSSTTKSRQVVRAEVRHNASKNKKTVTKNDNSQALTKEKNRKKRNEKIDSYINEARSSRVGNAINGVVQGLISYFSK